MILTSVDLPAPFSPSSARTEPPVATRSTPCSTSTPPNDLWIPRASSRKRGERPAPGRSLASIGAAAVTGCARLAALRLVVLRQVRRRDDHVRDVQLLRDRLVLDDPDQVRDADHAVLLGEVRRVGDPLLVRLDQAPRGRVRALAR